MSIQTLLAQEQDKEQSKAYMEQAQLMMDAGSLALEEIRDVMIQAAEFDTTSMKANFEAGFLSLETNSGEQATKYFMRVARGQPSYKFDLDYWIGNSYQDASNFDKSVDYYTRYKTKLGQGAGPEDAKTLQEVDRRIEECKNGKEMVASPKKFVIVNVGKEVNSEYEDYAPVLNEDETELIFTTRRKDGNTNENVFSDNKPWEEIFISNKEGEKWAAAKNIGAPVATTSHESTLALSRDGNTLLIYKDDTGAGDIYETKRQPDGTWSEPKSLDAVNSTSRESAASLSTDGKTLYFASDRPGGLGGQDIYVSSKDSRGQWSKAKNLGPGINSTFDEEGPFIDYEGKVLFFSSKGRKGMGGYDIFKSTLLDKTAGKWSEPENLGYPINSPDDDVFYIATKDGLRGYYSSVREDGLGYSDIYRIQLPEDPAKKEKTPVKFDVRVFDAATKKALDARVSLISVKDNTQVAMTSTRAGVYDFAITGEEEKDYRLTIEKDGYATQTADISIAGASEEVKTISRRVELKKPVATAKVETPKKEAISLKFNVRVLDAASKAPLDAKVTLTAVKGNGPVAMTNTSPGAYDFTITEKEAKDYRLSIEKEGYVFQNTNLNLAGASDQAKTITRTVELQKPTVGHTQILHNIYFDYNKATFKQGSFAELSTLETMMKQNPSLRLEIAGHTDSWGPDAYNNKLSLSRATAVKGYLLSKGINAQRVTAAGYGDTRPLASNDDEKGGREVNRRVEFKIIGK